MEKFALFVFNGDPMCFIHVLLNAVDLNERGHEVKIVVEGSAAKLIEALAETGHPLFPLWEKVKSAGLVDGVCRACATKMGTKDEAEKQGLTLLGDMSGHPAMGGYIAGGFSLITF